MIDVVIAGASVVPFGKHLSRSAADLGGEAVSSLLHDYGVSPERIQAGYVGSVYGGSLIAQRVLEQAGISGPPVFSVENACASGGSAMHLAWQAVRSGVIDCAVVVGVDQLSAFGGGALPLRTSDVEIDQGLIMPAAYAMRAQRYLYESQADRSVLDLVSVKNRSNGAANPRAHSQRAVSAEEVSESRMVADPLRLLHCTPNSDGAAAVLVCSADWAMDARLDSTRVAASVVKSGRFSNGYRDMTWPEITSRAARDAYEMAAITPKDLDIVELHDAFAIAELLHVEALGIAPRLEAHRSLANGDFERDGKVAVSPSGGLISRGHPVGATGVSQLAESFWQLTGKAGALQVDGASVALAHTTGGGIFGVDNGACTVHVLTA